MILELHYILYFVAERGFHFHATHLRPPPPFPTVSGMDEEEAPYGHDGEFIDINDANNEVIDDGGTCI